MENLFENIGGQFITPFLHIADKHKNIKAYIFDWDGVFNSGVKGEGISSPFYEPDSMGVNMLRFAFWLNFREVPLTVIMSGENNSSSFYFAKREHVHSVYFSMKNKSDALLHLNQTFGISPDNIAFVFDDILDIPVAEQCGLRILVPRKASPAFMQFVKNKKLCDYITASSGGDFAVREAAELMISSNGDYNYVIEERISSGYNYREYLSMRDAISTHFYTLENGNIVKKDFK